MSRYVPVTVVLVLMACSAAAAEQTELEWIRVGPDGADFVGATSGERFVVWGVNYDHDDAGRLIEDYWHDEWPTIEGDFAEIRALGANVVRIHLQLGKFMTSSSEPNATELERLARLVDLAERTGLYLDITGLGCYHKADVPPWYDALDEQARWDVQARFWEAVARVCADSPAIFCYDLMNEPILAGKEPETDWLAGDFAGKHFVQRICLDLDGRTRPEVARAWVDRLVDAVRKHDARRMITVGAIPWALSFPGAKPLFYSEEVGENLDFVAVHFYPETGKLDETLAALAVYDVGKPIVIEETFPLKCSLDEMDTFIERSRPIVDGWISFYWGKTIEELAARTGELRAALLGNWLEYFRDKGPALLDASGAGEETTSPRG